jgi:hypothetical protein
MNIGLWITPAVVASGAVILWIATWLEDRLVPPGIIELSMRPATVATRTSAVPRSEVTGAGSQPATRLSGMGTSTRKEHACTSAWEQSSSSWPSSSSS